jgi:hypothetical protein
MSMSMQDWCGAPWVKGQGSFLILLLSSVCAFNIMDQDGYSFRHHVCILDGSRERGQKTWILSPKTLPRSSMCQLYLCPLIGRNGPQDHIELKRMLGNVVLTRIATGQANITEEGKNKFVIFPHGHYVQRPWISHWNSLIYQGILEIKLSWLRKCDII